MTQSKIDIKVGIIGDENPELYEKVTVDWEFHKEKLLNINKSLSQICGSVLAPMVLIQLPSMDFQQPIASKYSLYQFRDILKNDRLYFQGNLKSPQHLKFVKNLNQTFSKLTELDSWIMLDISLYDSANINKTEQLWNQALIKGDTKIDQQFLGVFHNLIKTISPEFADSPIVILLELLESVDLNLNLEGFSLPEPEFKQLVNKFVGIDTEPESRFLAKMKETKEQATIWLTVGHLFSMKIQGPSRALAAFLAFS